MHCTERVRTTRSMARGEQKAAGRMGQIPCRATLAHHYPRPVNPRTGTEPESPTQFEQPGMGPLLCCCADVCAA